ncbi:MAG: hypothetical protein JSS27_10440 [Planctomycetes bacterium]|nr:hypothetical protein [Planctomycetota bacterium]
MNFVRMLKRRIPLTCQLLCGAVLLAGVMHVARPAFADEPKPDAPKVDASKADTPRIEPATGDEPKTPPPAPKGPAETPKRPSEGRSGDGERRPPGPSSDENGRRDRHRGGFHGSSGFSWQRDMHEHDPEMAKLFERDGDLERQTSRLADRWRHAKDDDERTKLKQELREMIQQHFKVRQERRELELKRLEEQLGRLRESLKRRASQEKEIIEQRLGELTAPRGPSGF